MLNKNVKNKERDSKQWTVHTMPSQRQEMEYLPFPKQERHLEMHNTLSYGPQMAVPFTQLQLNNGLAFQWIEGLKLCHSDEVDGEHSNANVKTIKNVSRHGIMHNMLPTIQRKGTFLLTNNQCIQTHNKSIHSPQLAVSSFLREMS